VAQARLLPQTSTEVEVSEVDTNQYLATSIFYPNFEITDGLQLVGHAQVHTPSEGYFPVLRLTRNVMDGQAGAVWYTHPLTVGNRFETVFDFRISGPDTDPSDGDTGGDGFAFVIHKDEDGPNTIGIGGCGIGYQLIEDGLAVEFDTFPNGSSCSYIDDPSPFHISAQTRGTEGPLSPSHRYSRGHYSDTIDLADGEIHTAKISYDAGDDDHPSLLKVYLDKIELSDTPILTIELNISETLGLGDGTAWVGFTAGSASSYENHDILNWYLIYDWDLTCLEYDFSQEMEDVSTVH
jgi:hypothetical protein